VTISGPTHAAGDDFLLETLARRLEPPVDRPVRDAVLTVLRLCRSLPAMTPDAPALARAPNDSTPLHLARKVLT